MSDATTRFPSGPGRNPAEPAGGAPEPSTPDRMSADKAVLALRAVHRAMADLRRGTPVVLDGAQGLAVLAAETAGARGLAEFAALAAAPPVLLLAPARAAAILGRDFPGQSGPVALRLPRGLLDPAALRGLADPTEIQLFPVAPERAADLPRPPADAALALAKLARLLPAAIAAPLRDGWEARAADLNLLRVAPADVLAYPASMAQRLTRVAEAVVPLEAADDARIVAFRGPDAGIEHLAILVGRPESARAPLVRIHSECFTGDLLGSLRCDCGQQLRGALRRMAADGHGVLLYLAQEGRGIGLVSKLRAYAVQDGGMDTLDANRALGWDADERSFLVAATMLEELGITAVRLLTNNPDKVAALSACGVRVWRESHAFAPNGVNDLYLATKAARFGHLFG